MCQDTSIFLEVLKPEYNNAVRYCKALCSKHSLDDAEDVLQQSLLKALESFDDLKDRTKFRSWFFKIITREFINFIRKNFWKKFLPLELSETALKMPEIFNRDENDEQKILLSNALSKISSKERAAILLFELGGFSIEEIKEIQNEKSNSAIKSRLSRARAKLRECLSNEKNNFFNSSRGNPAGKNKNQLIIGDISNETLKLIAETERK